jgi:hypothetical protein
MISKIKTSWFLISLPIITTFVFQSYETITFSSVFLPLYIIGTFSLKKLEAYSIHQKELNKIKLISYINDNIENAEDNYNIILPKLKELKSYYFINSNNIKKDLSNDYLKRENSKMLDNIRQNYKLSNVIIKSELSKNEELITSYKNYIDRLIRMVDEESNIFV